MEILKIILSLSILLILTSCGDLFMKDNAEVEIDLSQFASCELDIDAFSFILEKNIKGDILCLEDKLNLFMETVETDRPGFMSKSVLKDFLVNGPIDVESDVVNIVDSVFDLSYLILGSDKNYIKKTEVKVLIDFLVFFNKHIWKSFQLFNSEAKVNFNTHIKERIAVYNEFILIEDKLKSIYNPNRSETVEINLEEFVTNFFQKEPLTLKKVKSLMFMKRVFLGGDVWSLNTTEFESALDMLADLAQVAFDVSKTDKFDFIDGQRKIIEVYLRDVEIVRSNVFFDRNSDVDVFTIDNVIEAVNALVPEGDLPFELLPYKKEISTLKDVLLGSDNNYFSAKELRLAVNHAVNLLEEADFYYKVYNTPKYKKLLNAPQKLTINFDDFPINNSREQMFLINFSRIAQNYKFIKGDESSPLFDYDFSRNADGVFEIGALEYGIKIVMNHYGQKNPNARGGVDMSLEQAVTMMKDFRVFLRDQGIITVGRVGGGEVANTADNLVLMSTLFQYQSDGCDEEISCMEVPELTEFVVGLLTALNVKDFFTDEMLKLCAEELDQFDRISPICFRRNFIKVIETKMPDGDKSLADYMPLFYNYLQELISGIDPNTQDVTESEDYMKFITETEAFARTCMFYDDDKTEEIPLTGNDAFGVFAGLLNIESTMLKFDLNENGVLDGRVKRGEVNEVMKAYNEVYKSAMIALVAPNGGFRRRLAKPIFKYLIKEGTVPDESSFSSMWRFVKFLFKRGKSADAERVTISTVLKTLGEQSENAIKYPFKCDECLRDPNKKCEPEDGAWD